MSYHEKLAGELGLRILKSPTLDKLLQKRASLYTENEVDFKTTAEAGSVLCDRDEGYLSAIFHVLATAAKHPGRTTWVLGFTEEMGYEMVYLFACDSVRHACKLVRLDIDALEALVKKAA